MSGLKTKEFIQNLNSGNLEIKAYREVAEVRLDYVESKEHDNGFLEGLRFIWSNGISS